MDSLPDLATVWSFITGLGSLTGLALGVYSVVRELLDRPRLSLVVERGYPVGGFPSKGVGVEFTVRNRGKRPTSIEDLELAVDSREQHLKGRATDVSDRGKTGSDRRCLRPVPVPSDRALFLEALSSLDIAVQKIDSTYKCTLTMKMTHKTITGQCSLLPPREL